MVRNFITQILKSYTYSSYVPNLWCDKLCATYLFANSIFHAQRKLVEVDFHIVTEKASQGRLYVQFIPTEY